MDNFETTITYIRNLLRNEGINGLDSINHCIGFILLKFLNLEKCNLLDIPKIYAFENFDKNIPFNDAKLILKFYNKAEDEDF